ncbi:hypothetical protein H1R20_g8096, partial [Candolleomyces eurysporus]
MADLKNAICDLQNSLLRLSHQSDEELYQVEGQKMEAIVRQLWDTDRDGKRKMMGTVIAKFCTEYLEVRKAHRDGHEYKFTHDWRKSWATIVSRPKNSSKGERPAKSPAANVQKPSESKGNAPEPPAKQSERGRRCSKAGGFQRQGTGAACLKATDIRLEQPPKETGSSPKQENYGGKAACRLKLQNPGSAAHPVSSRLIKNTGYVHPAPKAPAGEPKKPVKTKTVAAKQPGESAPKTPVGSNQGSTSKTLAVQAPKKSSTSKSLATDVDELAKGKVKPQVVIKIPSGKSGETSKAAGEKEKAGGGKGKGKEIVKQRPRTSREEHKHGKALYDPAKDSDSSGYTDEPVGAKRKGKSGQKGSTSKKPKSVAILSDTSSESSIPIIQRRSLPTKKVR